MRRFYLILLLLIPAMVARAAIVDSGTKGSITYSLDDEGTLSISGSGEIPDYAFSNTRWSYAKQVKKIVFADDCAISKISNFTFACYSEDSQLSEVVIKTTVPLTIESDAFIYDNDEIPLSVNYTITAPSIVSIGKIPFFGYYTPRNIVFNVGEPIAFNKGTFSDHKANETITIPVGSTCYTPVGYQFKDPYMQEEYDYYASEGDEDWFWEDYGSDLVEGVDYTISEEETVMLTSENTNLVFGNAKVIFVDPTSIPSVLPTNGLVAYYPFNGNANDESGNGNHGTPMENVTLATGVNGDANGAYQFGGTDNPGNIHVPNSESLQIGDNWSFAAYVKPISLAGMTGWGTPGNSGRFCIMGKSHDQHGVAIDYEFPTEESFNVDMTSWGWDEIEATDETCSHIGKWTHIAVTKSGNIYKVFINGELLYEGETEHDFSEANSEDMYFGKYNDKWYPMNGMLDEVRIYNRTLTSDEITLLAQYAQTGGNVITDHEYVDLGLPSGTLWATCNVGANSPEEYGNYFAWGETEPKEDYSVETYKYCEGTDNTMTKYCSKSEYGYNGFTDNLPELLPEDDAATANWGSGWQMPSNEQIDELINSEYTTTEWTMQGGGNGRKITSKSNGNSIFLPAAGYRYNTSFDDAGSVGYYWSRSLRWDYDFDADILYFGSTYIGWFGLNRFDGNSIRPVVKGTPTPKVLSGELVLAETEFVYNGQPFTPDWQFSNEAYQSLVLDEDYTVTWSNNVLPGTATLTVTGKGNYTGSLTATFWIDKAPMRTGLYTLTLPNETYVYDGQPHGATIKVSEGVGDVKITYFNSEERTTEPPTDAGTYTIWLSIEEGTLYYGMELTQVGTVTINPKPLTGEIFMNGDIFVYNGQPITPNWQFSQNSFKDLVLNEDYTVTWSNNVLPGTATLTVTGKGNYTGSLTTTFTIDKAPLSSNLYVLTLPSGEYVYDGQPHGATIKVSEGVGKATFLYEEQNSRTESTTPPTMPGDYVIYLTIEDGMFYYGVNMMEVGSFTILALQLAEGITLDETEFVYNGQPFTPTWHFTGAASTDLVEGTDYVVNWRNNLYPGTGTLTVTGIGIYTGTLTANIHIDKAPLQANLYNVILPEEEYIYDEQSHGAFIDVAEGVGAATFTYAELDSGTTTTEPPTVPGSYDIFLTIADGRCYYGMAKTKVGHVTIKLYDVEKFELAKEMALERDAYPMYHKTREDLAQFCSDAEAALASGDLHSIYLAFQPMDDLLDEARASVEKYHILASYITQAEQLQEAYSPVLTHDANANARVTEAITNMQTAYNNGTLTDEEIDEVWPQFQETVRTELTGIFTPYMDRAKTLMAQGLIEDIHKRFAQALQQAQNLLSKAEYTVNEANYTNSLFGRMRSLVQEAEANVNDLAILRQAYTAMGGAGKLADYWQFETKPYQLNGVTFTNGQATNVVLENRNLTGNIPTAFFKLPKLSSLNLSHNNMTGDIAQVFGQLTTAGKTSPVATLNISYNQLSGNIGSISQVCTELRQLNASHNLLTECQPILSSSITSVDLSYQTLDWTWNFMLNGTQDNMQLLPGILRYDHQKSDGLATTQRFTCTLGDWSMTLGYANEQLTVSAPAGRAYMGANGALMDATLTTSTATGSTFQLQFNFLDGDANFSGGTDVLDLQSIINYMFNDWQSRAFNFTASNLYSDEVINVQDVVLMVDKLLDAGQPNNIRRNARIRDEETIDATDAYLYWSGNDLILNTATGVTAADICLMGDAFLTWELRQMGFTVTEKKDADGTHAVIYSLSGAEIPVGETIIAHRKGGNADPVSALLSDRYAVPVSVSLTESEATPASRLMAVEGQWRIYRTDGTMVAQGIGQAELKSVRRRLTIGVYILQGENKNTQKFTIK